MGEGIARQTYSLLVAAKLQAGEVYATVPGEITGDACLSTFSVWVRTLFIPTPLFWFGLENSFNIHIRVFAGNL